MKTKNQKSKIAVLAGLFFIIIAFSPAIVKAQCPQIANQLYCAVRVQVDVYSYNAQGVCNTVPCSTYQAFIPAGNIIPVVCGACNVCNVRVTVTNVGGVNVGNIGADFSTASPGNPIPLSPPACNPPGGADIYYIFGTFKIQ